jgi:hypothetical protein
LKTNKFKYNGIAGGFNYDIGQIEVLDSDKNIFVFNIRDRGDNSGKRVPSFLRKMDLSGESKNILLEKEVGDCGIVIRDKIIFVWQKNQIYAMNSNFEPIDHPLVTIFNNEKPKDYGLTVEFIIHPTLPFAIIKEEQYDKNYNSKTSVWSISWDENDRGSDHHRMFKLLSNESYYYNFSYDNKWLWFIDASQTPRKRILMPVDIDLPYFIGNPIYLGDVPAPQDLNGSAMTTNPSGLVVSDCEDANNCKLTKWDFTEAEKLIEKNK